VFLFLIVALLVILPKHLWGAFASQFSLTVGEGYSDNIFFTKEKDHDFITIITPTLSFLYAPEGQVEPTLNLNFSPYGQIFARHGELNSFGDNFSFNGAYTYQYSPRLNFYLSDNLQRFGQTRTVGLGNDAFLQVSAPVKGPPPPSGAVPGSLSRDVTDFLSGGAQLSNFFSLEGSYLYRPDVSFRGGYSNGYTNFIDQGGSDVSNTIYFRGVYNWRQDHNLHAGYSISIVKSRNGDSNTIQSFDIGDDYFSQYKLQLTPTLSLAASTGISFNVGSKDGPPVANNTNVTITKLWETATLSGSVQHGLTPSYGVAGISNTTSVFANFAMSVTEKLSVNSSVNFSLFDTDDVDFKTFQATLGLQYLITSWLSSALNYNFRWIDSSSGTSNSDLLTKGVVKANTVFLTLTSTFDLWPNIRLARNNLNSSTLPLVLRTPFPTPFSSPSPVTGP
jgi:hypothetical protein